MASASAAPTLPARAIVSLGMRLVRPLVDALERAGVPRQVVHDAFDLTPASLMRPDGRTIFRDPHAAWREFERVTGDPHIGVHVGEATAPGNGGIFEYILRCGPTLEDALRTANMLVPLYRSDTEVHLDEVGDEFVLTIHAATHDGSLLPRHCIEMIFVATIRFCWQATDHMFDPIALRIRNPRPDDVSELARATRCTPSYGAAANQLVLPRDAIERSTVGADPSTRRWLIGHASRLLHKVGSRSDLSRNLSVVYAEYVRRGHISLPTIASRLGITPRTLQRRLRQCGVTHQQLLDRTRRDIALEILESSDAPVNDVAAQLGYTDAGNFVRAFRRWTGTSPNRYRASQTQTAAEASLGW